MRRTPLRIALVVALALAIALPVAGLAAQDAGDQVDVDEQAPDANASELANTTAPGEQMAGVVGVQKAEIDSDIDRRSFGIQIAQAASNESRASIVGDRLAQIESDLDNLSERRQELEEARANGSISEGQYRAEVAEMAAQSGAMEQHANDTAEAAGGIPQEHLADRGINVSAIQMLQNDAANMSGPEVSQIAQSIAGPGVGQGAGPPSDIPGFGDNPGLGDDNPGMNGSNPGMNDSNPGMDDGNESDSEEETDGDVDDPVDEDEEETDDGPPVDTP